MASAGVACRGGTPLVVVACMVVHGSWVASTVGTFVVLVARIVGFASVGVVARDGRGGAGAGCPVAGDVGVVWRQSCAGGEVQVEILRHPTVAVRQFTYPVHLFVARVLQLDLLARTQARAAEVLHGLDVWLHGDASDSKATPLPVASFTIGCARGVGAVLAKDIVGATAWHNVEFARGGIGGRCNIAGDSEVTVAVARSRDRLAFLRRRAAIALEVNPRGAVSIGTQIRADGHGVYFFDLHGLCRLLVDHDRINAGRLHQSAADHRRVSDPTGVLTRR